MIKIGVVETEKRQMKKFWSEFKAFISKGNILDLAVGVVIGTAFNAIVTSLVNDLIMPLITWGLGAESLADLAIVLQRDAEGAVTLSWNYGNFIQTLINFLIIALSVFIALKVMMKSAEMFRSTANRIKPSSKEEKDYLQSKGIDLKDKKACKQALKERKVELEKIEKERQEKEAQEKYNNSTEGLLKEIRDLLKDRQEVANKKNDKEDKA